MSEITELQGITENSEEYYYEEGYESVEDIAHSSVDKLAEVKYVGAEKADDLIERALDYVYGQDDLETQYDPVQDEMVKAQSQVYDCPCGLSYQNRAVFIAHITDCPEVEIEDPDEETTHPQD